MNTINVVMGSSREYAYYSLVTIKSMFDSNRNIHFNIFFYYDEKMDDILLEMKLLIERYNNCFMPIYISDERKKNLNVGTDWWHNSLWYRYYCIEDLHNEYNRVLLIGNDVLVVNNIQSFYETDLGDKAILGTIDMGNYWGTYPDPEIEKYNRKKEDYINSDILVIDLKKAYGKISVQQMMRYCNENRHWALDQAVLNYEYHDLINVNNDFKYNYIPAALMSICSKEEIEKGIREATLIHYAAIKPWSEYHQELGHDLWYQYAEQVIKSDVLLKEIVYSSSKWINSLHNKEQELYKTINQMKNIIDEKNKHIYKMDRLFWLEDKLWTAANDGVFYRKLHGNNINEVSIYGCGVLGKRLLEICNKGDIKVKFFIDKNKKGEEEKIKIIDVDEIQQHDVGEAIIVTPSYIFDEIKKTLLGVKVKIISLEELI